MPEEDYGHTGLWICIFPHPGHAICRPIINVPDPAEGQQFFLQ